MKKIFKISSLAFAAILAACGGGGSSSGEQINAPYSITVYASKAQLPLNISSMPAGIGAYFPYTTTIYIEARKGNAPIDGGKDVFSCNIVGGLNSGSLYYLDGDKEHEDKDGNALAYRAVTLGSNSGAASFHFNSGNQAGIAGIVCSVTNPTDKKIYSASTQIVVGAATGQPASVITTVQAPRYLGTIDNLNGLRNNVGVQALVMDDANQPVPNPGAANILVRILPSEAAEGAKLISGDQRVETTSVDGLKVRTIGGVGEFSLSSGNKTGSIILQLVTDRYDNDVSNGIQDAVTSLKAVSVHKAISSVPLVITANTAITVNNNVPFITALSAEGGVPPYKWSSSGLPSGLILNETGIIIGTPKVLPGIYNSIITVTDDIQVLVAKNIQVIVQGALIEDIKFNIKDCPGDLNDACNLPAATEGVSYAYAFSATGGDVSKPVTWTFSGLPSWLKSNVAGSEGIISGIPKVSSSSGMPPVVVAGDVGKYEFFVTASEGKLSVTRKVSIKVDAPK